MNSVISQSKTSRVLNFEDCESLSPTSDGSLIEEEESFVLFDTIRNANSTARPIVKKEQVVTLSIDHYENESSSSSLLRRDYSVHQNNNTNNNNNKKKKQNTNQYQKNNSSSSSNSSSEFTCENKKKKKKKTQKKKKKNIMQQIVQLSDLQTNQSSDKKEEKQLQEEEIMLQHLPAFDSLVTHKRMKTLIELSYEPRLAKTSIEYHNNRISPKSGSPKKVNPTTDKYKTELCRPYLETHHCKYGSRCRYAHGKKELKTVTRHPNFRTVLCLPYHYEGICTYGVRCCYIHNAEEEIVGRMIAENIDLVDHYQKSKRLPIFEILCCNSDEDNESIKLQEIPFVSDTCTDLFSGEADAFSSSSSSLRLRGIEPTLC